MEALETKTASFTNICLVLLRAVRIERDQTQAQVADMCSMTPSAWTKIETGKTPLSFEHLLRWCAGMCIQVSTIIATAERYTALMSDKWRQPDRIKWTIVSLPLDIGEDDFLTLAHQYWSSPGFKSERRKRIFFNSVLDGPTYHLDGSISIAPVFQFALDPSFRADHLLSDDEYEKAYPSSRRAIW